MPHLNQTPKPLHARASDDAPIPGWVGEAPRAVQRERIIPDRAEFVESLNSLSRGHVLVRTGDTSLGCILDGAFVHHSFPTLLAYQLIAQYDNPFGFPGVEYYRITARGREFADRAWKHWKSRTLWERLAVRLIG